MTRLTKLARASNLDPVLVLRMEMESVLTGPAASGNSIEDEKYGLLPENFSEKYYWMLTHGDGWCAVNG